MGIFPKFSLFFMMAPLSWLFRFLTAYGKNKSEKDSRDHAKQPEKLRSLHFPDIKNFWLTSTFLWFRRLLNTSAFWLKIHCQTQFQLASSVPVQLRTEISLIITVRPPHPPTQASLNSSWIEVVPKGKLVYSTSTIRLGI